MKEVFIIRTGALGDAVLTLPLLLSAGRTLPGSRICVIGSYPLCRLVRSTPLADEAFPVEQAPFYKFFSEGGIDRQWAGRFRQSELVLSLTNDPVLIDNIRRAGVRNLCSVPARGRHMADRIFRMLPGAAGTAPPPGLFLSSEEKAGAFRFMRSLGLEPGKTACVHPGSGSKKKNWPVERFAAVGRMLAVEYGYKIFLPVGEADEEEAQELAESMGPGRMVAARGIPLRRLAAVLGACSVYVGNDSGVSHLAAAAGAPSVCVFGPTDPGVWAPRGREVAVVRKKLPCSPCARERRNSCAGPRCLEAVGPGEVFSAAAGLIK